MALGPLPSLPPQLGLDAQSTPYSSSFQEVPFQVSEYCSFGSSDPPLEMNCQPTALQPEAQHDTPVSCQPLPGALLFTAVMNRWSGVACVTQVPPLFHPIASAVGATGQAAGLVQPLLTGSKSAPTASHAEEDSQDTPCSAPCGAPVVDWCDQDVPFQCSASGQVPLLLPAPDAARTR